MTSRPIEASLYGPARDDETNSIETESCDASAPGGKKLSVCQYGSVGLPWTPESFSEVDRRLNKWRSRLEQDRPFSRDELYRAFNEIDEDSVQLEESIATQRARLQQTERVFEEVEELRFEIIDALLDTEDTLAEARKAGASSGSPASDPSARTAHSTRGPIGIREPILSVMRRHPKREWTIEHIRKELRLRGLELEREAVQAVLARMARVEEIERVRHGIYAFRGEGKEESRQR
jgi:hypothetical protein